MTDTLSNDTDSWESLGTHTFRRCDDVITFRAQGDFTVQDMRSLVQVLLPMPRPSHGFFYVSNISQLRHQTQQAANEMRAIPLGFFRAIAIVGATFAHRVLLDTMSRIARFLRVGVADFPIRYFATEEEALAWFDRIRRGEE